MHIRPAAPNDFAALYAFTSALALDHPPTAEAHAENLGFVLADDRSAVFVADDGALTGYALGAVVPMPLYGGATAFLQELYVDADHRGSGVGRALVEAFLDWGGARGAVRAVVATSRAGAFYESLGFATRPTAFYQRTIG
jgi:GNAT superfamily N-acetyltransferase